MQHDTRREGWERSVTTAIAPDIIGAKTKATGAPRRLSALPPAEYPSLAYIVANHADGPPILRLGPFGHFCEACIAAHRAYTGTRLYVIALPTSTHRRRIARIITRGYRS